MIFKVLYRNAAFLFIVLAILLSFVVITALLSNSLISDDIVIPFFGIQEIFKGSTAYLLVFGILNHCLIVLLLSGISSELKLSNNGINQIAIVYLLFLSVIEMNLLFSPALFSSFLVLAAIRYLLQFQVRHSIHAPLLISNALLVFAALIYPPAAVFIVPALIALMIFRSFDFREILIFLIGLLLPLFYFFGILYISENLDGFPAFSSLNYVIFKDFDPSVVDITGMVFFVLLSLIAFMNIFSDSFKMIVRIRNFYKVWSIFFLAALSTFLFNDVGLPTIFLSCTPFFTLAVCHFISQLRKSWYIELAMLMIVLLSFISELVA